MILTNQQEIKQLEPQGPIANFKEIDKSHKQCNDIKLLHEIS